MPESAPGAYKCGTYGAGWLSGSLISIKYLFKTLSKNHLNKKLFSLGKPGGHPTVGEGKVTRTINFQYGNMTGLNWYLEYGTSAAYSTTTAQVVNCGLFYVYQLKDPPQCDMAYCGYDVPGEKYFQML